MPSADPDLSGQGPPLQPARTVAIADSSNRPALSKNIFQNPLTFAEQNAIIKRGIMYYFQKEERKSIIYI